MRHAHNHTSGVKMEKLKLIKDWNKHKAGSTVTVDPVRAEWLKVKGFIKKGKDK